jgi:hypothetical protein
LAIGDLMTESSQIGNRQSQIVNRKLQIHFYPLVGKVTVAAVGG